MGPNIRINVITNIYTEASSFPLLFSPVALNFLLSCSFILLPIPFLYLFFLIYLSRSLFTIIFITYFSFCYWFSYFLFCKLTSSQIDRQSKTSDRGEKMLGGEDKVLFVCMCIHCVLRWGKDKEGIQYVLCIAVYCSLSLFF